MSAPHPASVHGGHSGQFCGHAANTLEEIVQAYIASGYPWVGITEHMPPVSDAYRYPEEVAAGLDAGMLRARFADYMATGRRLQARYAADIRLFVGFETEDYPGSRDLVRELIAEFSPDYVVGSLHHVDGIPFDLNRQCYTRAADHCGGMDGLYFRYFDQQYEMLRQLKPRVVGHLDIIRIFDADYRRRLTRPSIWERVLRNLALVKELDLILDFNLRPLSRGEAEPYLCAPILEAAVDLEIDIVPGDDSHGVKDIGTTMQTGIRILQAADLRMEWRKPLEDV